jgi:hypothetical protein
MPDFVTALRYLVMKPHRIMSVATHANSGSTRVTLLRTRYP